MACCHPITSPLAALFRSLAKRIKPTKPLIGLVGDWQTNVKAGPPAENSQSSWKTESISDAMFQSGGIISDNEDDIVFMGPTIKSEPGSAKPHVVSTFQTVAL
jgi:hypothetical protein